MNADRLDQLIEVAIAEGILPHGTRAPADAQRPWPVILLTGLGAWLAALPLLFGIGVAFNGLLLKGAWPYLVGGVMLALTTALLRRNKLPLFVEQFMLPGLLVGGGMLAYGLQHDLGSRSEEVLMAMLALAIGGTIRRGWLRVLLGAAACCFALLAMQPPHRAGEPFIWWLSLHLALGSWVTLQWLDREMGTDARRTMLLEWTGLGWILVTLAALAFWSGMTMLAGASMPDGGGNWHGEMMHQPWSSIAQAASALLAVCAGAWLARCWPSLRQAWSGLAALVLVALAWLMPSLGATLLLLAIFCSGRRWRLAMAAGAAAAWIIGAFYYQLSFPLATKALMLVAAGALLAAIAWMALHGRAPASGGAAPSSSIAARIGIAVCALAVLGVANVGIWQKETLIAEGRPVFVEMAPVDPRSLMQGDYMRLAFRLPRALMETMQPMPGATRPHAVGKIDAQGILTLERLDDGRPIAPDELAIELTPKNNGWALATDAWYFKEGEAARWSRAKYGEFRVDAAGRALLVGLRGPALEAL
jgi:uncharacterized membrane-anchored protein